VANFPFSTKAWSNGLNPGDDEFKRFEFGIPPDKNGDYAFLLHILACLKSTGKGAVIHPHGVLFRGGAEAVIRKEILRRGYIRASSACPPTCFTAQVFQPVSWCWIKKTLTLAKASS